MKIALFGSALMLALFAAPFASACHGQTVTCEDASWTDGNMSPDSVTITPSQKTVVPGGSYEYHIVMSLTAGCGSSYFLYTSLSTVPAGWSATYMDGPGKTGSDISNKDNVPCGQGAVTIHGYLNVTAPVVAQEGDTAVITAMMGADDNARNDKDLVYVKTTTRVHIPDPPPVVQAPIQPFSFPEDTEDGRIDLSKVFRDTDDDPVTYAVSTPRNMTVNIWQDGRTLLKPKKDWNGMEVLAFTCTDGITMVSANAVITVTPVPDPPVVAAAMKDFAIAEDGSDITSVNLNKVFYDPDTLWGSDELTFTYSGNDRIAVSIKADGKVEFKPAQGWSGSETIAFNVTDQSAAHATDDVKVTVTDSARPPFLKTPLNDLSILEDSFDAVSVDLTQVFGDLDLDSVLTYGCDKNTFINVTIDAGKVTFTPMKDWNGYEVIEFWASDGMFAPAYDDIRVTVMPVNDKPFAKKFLNITMDEDSTSAPVYLEYYFGDVDRDKLIFGMQSTEDLTVLISSRTSELTITPRLNYNGNTEMTLSVSDGQDGFNLQVPVNVTPIDDSPLIVKWTPAGNSICTEGDEVQFSIEAMDIDGDELGALWEIEGCFTYLKKFEDKFSIKFKATRENGCAPGQRTITAWIDGSERSSASHSWVLTVRLGNQPPSVPLIRSPSPTQNYTTASTIQFEAFSEDLDRDPITYTWYIDGADAGQGERLSKTLPLGTHVIKVVVSDTKGASTTSEEMSITVVKPPPKPSDKKSPGFEGLALVAALGVMLVLLRRKK